MVQFLRQYRERLSTHLNGDPGVALEVVVPVWVGWRSSIGGHDGEAASSLREVAQRRDALARPWPADASLVRPELLNDLGVGVVAPRPEPTPSKMTRATDHGEALGMSKPRVISVSTGPVRTGYLHRGCAQALRLPMATGASSPSPAASPHRCTPWRWLWTWRAWRRSGQQCLNRGLQVSQRLAIEPGAIGDPCHAQFTELGQVRASGPGVAIDRPGHAGD